MKTTFDSADQAEHVASCSMSRAQNALRLLFPDVDSVELGHVVDDIVQAAVALARAPEGQWTMTFPPGFDPVADAGKPEWRRSDDWHCPVVTDAIKKPEHPDAHTFGGSGTAYTEGPTIRVPLKDEPTVVVPQADLVAVVEILEAFGMDFHEPSLLDRMRDLCPAETPDEVQD